MWFIPLSCAFVFIGTRNIPIMFTESDTDCRYIYTIDDKRRWSEVIYEIYTKMYTTRRQLINCTWQKEVEYKSR